MRRCEPPTPRQNKSLATRQHPQCQTERERGDVLLSQVALGEANGLMTFMKLGRSRSAMQALGIRPGVLLEPSAANLGMLAMASPGHLCCGRHLS